MPQPLQGLYLRISLCHSKPQLTPSSCCMVMLLQVLVWKVAGLQINVACHRVRSAWMSARKTHKQMEWLRTERVA